MCEAAEPKTTTSTEYWTEENLLNLTVEALVRYGFIAPDQVVSHYYNIGIWTMGILFQPSRKILYFLPFNLGYSLEEYTLGDDLEVGTMKLATKTIPSCRVLRWQI